ncbi:MAG: CBS domain-containing protein [Acidobacteriota bacterium]|nr:CBS domain-containing protein [Acidobacteriota bacterium]MDH3524841.1 CBS domain-containing protein [Acidobacteriota bacterium]
MPSRISRILGSVRIADLPRRRVCRVAPATTLGEVYRRLEEEESVAVLVEEDGVLVGIFTERDVLDRTALEADPATPVGELMTRDDLVTLDAGQPITDAIAIMTARRIRHIPLVDADGKEDGMIGGRDVLRLIADYYPETLLNLPPRLHQRLTRPEGG